MNKILNLFNQEFVLRFLPEEVLKPAGIEGEIKSLKISPYKKQVWTSTYHVVLAYSIKLEQGDGKKKNMKIVLTAHSGEDRESVFRVLNFLWKAKFPNKEFKIPKPLVYNKEYNASFYQAVKGEDLLQLIKIGVKEEIRKQVKQTARLLHRLHQLEVPDNLNSIFTNSNARIKDVVPGVDNILREIENRFPHHLEDIKYFYDYFIKEEEDFLSKTDKRYIIHGDLHPENILTISDTSLALIDFTDFTAADFARDLGTFMQQLEYKIKKKMEDPDFAIEMKELFLQDYLALSNLKLDDSLQKRLDLYYNWTASRTAIYLLLKFDNRPSWADEMIKSIKNNLRKIIK